MIENDPVTYSGPVASVCYLKGHQLTVGRDHRIRCLPTFVVVEPCQTNEVLAGAIKAKLPDVDVAHAVVASEFSHLAITFDSCVLAIREDAFAFVVRIWRL